MPTTRIDRGTLGEREGHSMFSGASVYVIGCIERAKLVLLAGESM